MIRLYNTFEIAVPLWDWIIEKFESRGLKTWAVISKGIYRAKPSNISQHVQYVWTIPFLRKYKLVSHLTYFLLTPIKILWSRPKVNIFYTQPPLFYILGAFCSRLVRIPYVVHIMDFQPELLVVMGKLRRTGPVYKLLNFLGLRALKKAEEVIVIGRCMQSLLVRKGVNEKRIQLIHNVSTYSPGAVVNTGIKSDIGLAGKSIILYSGNMGVAHEFETILGVSKRLARFSSLHFLFVGKGVHRSLIENFIADQSPVNVSLIDYLPDDKFQEVSQESLAHFISLKSGYEGLMVPSKFYSSIAAGKPVIYEGGNSSEIALLIAEHGLGKSVLNGDIDEMERYIVSLVEDPGLVRQISKNCRATHDGNFRPSIIAQNYLQCIDEVIKRRE
ncbi:glycosyltransferase family 4 protein [Imperialibacter sp.]|uniref:glycosyltransferase family 4 protein n=1 Tax=Imperialibacter sp. TaxID=2038411 RepID=UPI0032EEB074